MTAEYRAAVVALVAEMRAAAHALEQALANERSALQGQEPDGLSAATAAKRECVAALERLEEQRRSLCRDADHPLPPGHMPALLARCDAPSQAVEDWHELTRTVTAAERLNAANGAIVHLKREQLAAALSILTGARADASATYGPGGARAAGTGRRELVRA